MRPLLFSAILISHSGFATAQDYVLEFRNARGIEKSDPQASIDGMLRSFHQAQAAGSHEYTSVAGFNACNGIYRQGKVVECGKLAREVISAMAKLDVEYPDDTIVRSVQLFGYMERGLLAEGKIGAAWQTNRAAAEILRGKKVSPDGDGRSITLADLGRLAPIPRSYGLRLIEREANLMDLLGRSNEALKRLDESEAYFGKNWPVRLDESQRFYAFKLLASRADLIDFLGDDLAAIQAQQDLAASIKGIGDFEQSYLTNNINLLRNLSQWNGPSQEYLDQARAIAARIKSIGTDNHIDRLVAKMELDFKQSEAPLETLRLNALKQHELGDAYSALYADRDYLVARVNAGEEDLDDEFKTLLKTIRTHGNKRGEPTLFFQYAEYLQKQNRPAEAIAMYVECLRMTRGFDWVLHEPNILGSLIDAKISAGDLPGARATLAELAGWLEDHPDAPAANRASATGMRAKALAALGDEAAAREAFQLAREIAKGLPAHQQEDYNPEQEALAFAEKPSPGTTASEPSLLRVQPLETTSVATPGNSSSSRFTIYNPTAHSIQGAFVLTGPGGRQDTSVRFTAGEPDSTFKQNLTVAAGDGAHIEISLAPGAGVDSATVRVAWENAGQAPGPDAKWDVTWKPAARHSIVLDASLVEANPYRSVSLFHELAVPLGESLGIPFRLRSPVPLRLEYMDAATHELIAVDANGNGDFREAGDFHIRGPGEVGAAIFPIAIGSKSVTAEIRIISPDGLPVATVGKPLTLEAEIHRNGKWEKEAEDVLK